MQRALATSADGEMILKLYELRTEAVMRKARHWIAREFWPGSAADVFAVMDNPEEEGNAYLRQVVTYWEMAAALVLHGALSAELFVDCNAEPFFLLAKFAPMMPEIHERHPTWFTKTLLLIEQSQPAAMRYEATRKNVDAMRERHKAWTVK